MAVNLRKKHLDAICTKIATFVVTETYADEEADLRKKLSEAIRLIDEVSAACVENDDKRDEIAKE
ncbi:MAG: hypothetical protein AB1817_19890 [Chloroflexota bacterium]